MRYMRHGLGVVAAAIVIVASCTSPEWTEFTPGGGAPLGGSGGMAGGMNGGAGGLTGSGGAGACDAGLTECSGTCVDLDRDAAHCFYPHEFSWGGPGPETVLTGGDRVRLSWSSTGPFDEPVRLDWSVDGGADWSPIAASTLDEGAYLWSPPTGVLGELLFRLSRTDDHGVASTCSGVISAEPVRLRPPRKGDRGWRSRP